MKKKYCPQVTLEIGRICKEKDKIVAADKIIPHRKISQQF
jgi:hypothetical protein